MTTPAVGAAVADFTAASTQGPFTLSAHRGHPVVLFFYPKDNTPGCTSEAQAFRDLHDQFVAAGAVVAGVSRDSLASHERFAERQALPYALIADTDEQLCTQFDVIKMKNLYGKQVRGIVRSTFLIDPTGHLSQSWIGVKVPGHADAVLAALQDLR